MSKLLTTEAPLVLLPSLALEFGITEALVLQQLHYLIGHAETLHGGKVWTYQTAEQWHAMLPFFSTGSIRLALSKLKKIGVVLVEKLARWKSNRTNYYTIDYVKLAHVAQIANENGALVPIKLAQKTANASAKTKQIDLPESGNPICQNLANAYTKNTNKREQQRSSRDFLKNEKPQQPSGTTQPTQPDPSPDQIASIPIDQRQLWQQLRQAKLDISLDDPCLRFWIDRNHLKTVVQTVINQIDGHWHTPAQLGLPRPKTAAQSSTSVRTAA